MMKRRAFIRLLGGGAARGRSRRARSSGPQADGKCHERHRRVARIDRPE
jgi:hypothetical protein